ncbi:MAG TPA: hypothetical protein VJZ00_22435 [Thermoanaerobaculia bacterium]|nr:hypothetical protein [Thermoanaerobaculia bacterium]
MLEAGPYRERTNLRVVVLSGVVLLLGIILIIIAGRIQGYPTSHAVTRDFGSALVVTGSVALLWELFSRRTLLAELLHGTRLAEAIQKSGIVGVSQHWYNDIEWLRLFRSVHHLDIFFSYSDKWRNAFTEEMRAFAARGKGRMRVVLPDPDAPEVVAALAKRFERQDDQVRLHIVEARQEFERLFSENAHPDFEWGIWYLPKEPMWSCYRFDDTIILSLYRHRRRGEVPTLILDRRGTFFEFVYAEFDAMVLGKPPLAREVVSSGNGTVAPSA